MKWLRDFGNDMPMSMEEIRRMMRKERRSNAWMWVAVVTVLVAGIAGVFWWMRSRDERMSEEYFEYFDDEDEWEDEEEYDEEDEYEDELTEEELEQAMQTELEDGEMIQEAKEIESLTDKEE